MQILTIVCERGWAWCDKLKPRCGSRQLKNDKFYKSQALLDLYTWINYIPNASITYCTL